jgi:hypothetical protein
METPPNTEGANTVNRIATADNTKYTLDGRQRDLNREAILGIYHMHRNVAKNEKNANITVEYICNSKNVFK